MDNKFYIDSDEIKRILSLHEESTKKQYLNVLNEQLSKDNNSYTLMNHYTLIRTEGTAQHRLKIFKGTTFFKTQYVNTLTTKDNTSYQKADMFGNTGSTFKGKIVYNCSSGKFSIFGEEGTYYHDDDYNPETLIGRLRTVCNNKTVSQPNQGDTNKVKTIDNQNIQSKKVHNPTPQQMDLSQITKSLPAEYQKVIQLNKSGQPDFNQVITQLKEIQ